MSENTTEKLITDVHTSHCCAMHGCKYGDEDGENGDGICTVTSGKAPQQYTCEYCPSIQQVHEAMEENRKTLAFLRLLEGRGVNVTIDSDYFH